jgi:predicted Zn-dependent protease with MMP-like domain
MSPLSQTEFMALVAEAMDALPTWVHETMDNLEILVDDEPPGEGPAEILGLYEGIPLTERNDDYGGVLPDRITLFSDPIEREAKDSGTPVVEVITRTLRHEVAHHFGIDDDRLFQIDAY